ncbi:MAG: cytochrome c oxidase subunit 4, partial [Acidimicrobiia bacterium]|nr:cytochrome c oxidase subunit 4 [Acidimicrobiia bacterium]
THLDEWWHRKYGEDEDGRTYRRENIESLASPAAPAAIDADGEAAGQASPIHLPSPSYWPLVVAISLPLIGYGLIYTYWLAGLGGLVLLAGIYGWGLEPSVDPDTGHGEHHGPEPTPDEPEAEAEAVAREVEEPATDEDEAADEGSAADEEREKVGAESMSRSSDR